MEPAVSYSTETLREKSQYTSLISLKLLPNDPMTKVKEMHENERVKSHKEYPAHAML